MLFTEPPSEVWELDKSRMELEEVYGFPLKLGRALFEQPCLRRNERGDVYFIYVGTRNLHRVFLLDSPSVQALRHYVQTLYASSPNESNSVLAPSPALPPSEYTNFKRLELSGFADFAKKSRHLNARNNRKDKRVRERFLELELASSLGSLKVEDGVSRAVVALAIRTVRNKGIKDSRVVEIGWARWLVGEGHQQVVTKLVRVAVDHSQKQKKGSRDASSDLNEFRFGASERLTFSQARTALVVELKSSEKREVTVVANDLNRLNQLLSLRDVGTTRKFDMSALYKTFSGGGGPKFPLASILEGVGIKDAVLENAGNEAHHLLKGFLAFSELA